MLKSFIPLFCCKSFLVSHLFMWCKIRIQFHYFLCGYPVSPISRIEVTVVSPFVVLALLLRSFAHIYMGLFLGYLFSNDPYMCLYARTIFFYYCSFVVCFEVMKCDASRFVILSQDDFGHWDPLQFHRYFRILFLFLQKKKKKKCHLNFDRNCIECIDDFGSMNVSVILSILIHEQRITFYLFSPMFGSFWCTNFLP